MSISIGSILETHQRLLKEREAEIQFKIDREGKRILNKKTSRFYVKRILARSEIIDIVVTSFVVIEKMSKLKRCDWPMTELGERLYNSIEYYENYFNVDLSGVLDGAQDNASEFKDDLNEKFPATFRAMDGHYVRSEAEQTIDDFLFRNGVIHAYEKRLPGDKCFYCDFYIPPRNNRRPIYIEYWGRGDDRYLARKSTKLDVYKREQLQLIEVTKNNLRNLKAYLTEKLRLFHVILE
jgi:hypothetical protein